MDRNSKLDSIVDATSSEYRTTKINGKQYQIKLLPGLVGIEIQERLLGSFLPSVGVAFDNFEGGFERVFPEDSPYTDLAVAIAANLNKLGLKDLIPALLKDAYCDNQPIDIDSHFMANYGEMYLLVAFAFKENFGDVFPVVLGALGLETHTLRTKLEGLLPKKEEQKKQTTSKASSKKKTP